MIDTILLDVDGVCADFFTATLLAHNAYHLYGDWPSGEWDMAQVMEITDRQFWKPIDNYKFWRSVPVYAGARDFYAELCKRATVVFATHPSQSAGCAKAKIEWLRDRFGSDIKYMLGPRKDLMARPTTLLIDDYDKNIQNFGASGGHVVLFPRVWNKAWGLAKLYAQPDLYRHVLERVDLALAAASEEKPILQEAHELTTVTRQGTYGHPLDDFTKTGLIWTGVLYDLLKPDTVIPAERVALCMTGVKLSREVNMPKRDNRVDGVGYLNCLQMLIDERKRRTNRKQSSNESV